MLDADALAGKFPRAPVSIVVGYHATSARAARAILRGQPFRLSRNQYDWLGNDVYFWEAAPQRAWDWAHTPRVRRRLGADSGTLPYTGAPTCRSPCATKCLSRSDGWSAARHRISDSDCVTTREG